MRSVSGACVGTDGGREIEGGGTTGIAVGAEGAAATSARAGPEVGAGSREANYLCRRR